MKSVNYLGGQGIAIHELLREPIFQELSLEQIKQILELCNECYSIGYEEGCKFSGDAD